LVYSAFVAILGVGCDGVCPPCTKLESEVLSAVVSGDTLVLAEYLEGSSTYDFHCREHVDALREGERLSRMVQYTKHTPILRTYLRYPIPTDTKNAMLWGISGHATSEGMNAIKMLLAHDAHLDHPDHRCHLLEMVDTFMKFDSLGYDFNWVSDRTGNNILMDYCSCSEDFQRDDLGKVLRYFVSLGVRTDIKNHDGETAYDIANRSGVIEVLREAEKERP
jgi:hypothetical protein